VRFGSEWTATKHTLRSCNHFSPGTQPFPESPCITQLADHPAFPGYLFIPQSIVAVDIPVVTEPLPSYQQFLIFGFCGRVMCPLPGDGQAGTYIFPQIFRPFGQNATFLPAYALPYTYTIR
jgi:hypothetical protein